MDRLLVLSKIVETREVLVAKLALEGPLTGVLSNVTSKMLRPGEGHATVVVAGALKDSFL